MINSNVCLSKYHLKVRIKRLQNNTVNELKTASFFIAFKVWTAINNKVKYWKYIYLCKFHATGEEISEYEKFFGEKSQNQDKLTPSGISGQATKNRDCPGKPRTVGLFIFEII